MKVSFDFCIVESFESFSPKKKISPLSGISRLAIFFKKVDLPAPFSPIKAQNRPFRALKSSRGVFSEKDS